MNLREPHLSKSRYLTGLQCDKRLWLGWHEPVPKLPNVPGSIFAVGTDVGEAARRLYPGGVLVAEGPREFAQAQERTCQLLADAKVSTIFEAAITYQNVVVRPDVIQRQPNGKWALLEVKSTTSAKTEHIDDLAVQAFVLRGAGLDICSMALIHVNRDYIMSIDGIDWEQYFHTIDLTERVEQALAVLPEKIRRMQQILALTEVPEVEPSSHCFTPFDCEFWDRCTASKPRDWIFYLPGLRAEVFSDLAAAGVERMSSIPADFPLTAHQRAIVDCANDDREWVSPALERHLDDLGPPAFYLDFETGAPAIPLYTGSRPYQRIPFQWSLHRLDVSGAMAHRDFLPDCQSDPRRAFAESLLDAAAGDAPVIVYSSFEGSVLDELAMMYPSLAEGLRSLKSRLRDLLPIVRRSIIHLDFKGSYSIKSVAPVLAPDVTYDDLQDIADGGAASAAFYRLATAAFRSGETADGLRASLCAYCARDTYALAMVHRALRRRATLTVRDAG